MIDHAAHEFSEVVQMGNQAYQMVTIVSNNFAVVIFAFPLSRQLDGEFEGMW